MKKNDAEKTDNNLIQAIIGWLILVILLIGIYFAFTSTPQGCNKKVNPDCEREPRWYD